MREVLQVAPLTTQFYAQVVFVGCGFDGALQAAVSSRRWCGAVEHRCRCRRGESRVLYCLLLLLLHFGAVLSAAKTTFVFPLAGAGLFSVREDAVRISLKGGGVSLHSIIDVVPSNI